MIYPIATEENSALHTSFFFLGRKERPFLKIELKLYKLFSK